MPDFTFADRLNEALTIRDITAAELSKQSGASEGLISGYRKGKYKAKQGRLDRFAQILDVSIPWLMGYDVPIGNYDGGLVTTKRPLPSNILPMPRMVKKPRLGTIACGKPILAVEEADEFDEVPEDIPCDFTLKCKGDSMINARIFDGDIVCIRAQDHVENGEIAAVLLDREEATLKRVRLYDDHVSLEADNPMYAPIVLWEADMNRLRILGRATHFISRVR